jgi:hypothetical protein
VNDRRVVRATPDLFAQLDFQLGDERGPNGEPSSADFQAYELLPIVERFATGWGDLPEVIPGRPEYRVLITEGHIVRAIAVTGQLAPDGAVDLVRIRVDLTPPDPEQP